MQLNLLRKIDSERNPVHRLTVVSILLGGVIIASVGQSSSAVFAPASAIGNGKTFWVNSSPEDARASVIVDVGNLHQIDDSVETQFKWELAGESLRTARKDHPGVSIPAGSSQEETKRVVCGPEGLIAVTVENKILSLEGKLIEKEQFDPVRQRHQQETSKLHTDYPFNYGRTPASLVCLAAARKCEGQDLSWPPSPRPRHATPDELRQYSKQFVPSCKM